MANLERGFGILNLYEAVRANPSYSKLEIGDFLFAETEPSRLVWALTLRKEMRRRCGS